MKLSTKSFFIWAALVSATSGARAADDPKLVAEFEKELAPFLQKHCVRCHDDKKQKGDFRLDTLSRDIGGGDSVSYWAEVVDRIGSGEMPPDDEDILPTAEEISKASEWITDKIAAGEVARLAKREPVTFHRLSRAEYGNTVYDLLGVNFDVADPTGLSEDDEWHGFERIGSVLSLSASHVEKYLAAADSILNEAFPDETPQGFLVRKKAYELRGGKSPELDAMIKDGTAEKIRVDVWPGHEIQGGRPGPGVKFPIAGEYKVRIKLSGLKPPGGRSPHLSFYAKGLDRMLFETDVVAPEDEPTIVEFQTHLPAGSHSFVMTNDVPGPSNLPRSGRSGNKHFFSTAEGRIPWQRKMTDEEGNALEPFLIVDWVEWEGPIITEEARQRRSGLLPEEDGNLSDVRRCLETFAERAFRRPLRKGEVDQYVTLAESEVAAGETIRAAAKTGMLAILCSKDFYYLVEGEKGRKSPDLTDWEIASRLSYFLWSTMPDAPLLAAAREGKLKTPDELKKQVVRMLADPRAKRFSETFPHQWLQLGKVGMFPPDKKLYPDYDKWLEASMVAETTEFFRHVLENRLSLREFINSEWSMLNPRLAIHYGIEQPANDGFQRVLFQPDDQRGGLLRHASVLSLTSDGTRHRPVHRGAWILESIFGKTPPPPPANVDPIEPTPPEGEKVTVRMKLEAHTSNESCASCHRKIDPLGLAFDNYDAIGRWRTVEVMNEGKGADPKVDASGELPDGRKFSGAAEFQDLLMDDLDQFQKTFIEKLATFALRRAMTVDDRSSLEAIAAKGKAADYELAQIVEELVTSELFRRR